MRLTSAVEWASFVRWGGSSMGEQQSVKLLVAGSNPVRSIPRFSSQCYTARGIRQERQIYGVLTAPHPVGVCRIDWDDASATVGAFVLVHRYRV